MLQKPQETMNREVINWFQKSNLEVLKNQGTKLNVVKLMCCISTLTGQGTDKERSHMIAH